VALYAERAVIDYRHGKAVCCSYERVEYVALLGSPYRLERLKISVRDKSTVAEVKPSFPHVSYDEEWDSGRSLRWRLVIAVRDGDAYLR
jgi:hypothetical protein